MNSPSSFYSTIRLNRNKVLPFAAAGNLNDIARGGNGTRAERVRSWWFAIKQAIFILFPLSASSKSHGACDYCM